MTIDACTLRHEKVKVAFLAVSYSPLCSDERRRMHKFIHRRRLCWWQCFLELNSWCTCIHTRTGTHRVDIQCDTHSHKRKQQVTQHAREREREREEQLRGATGVMERENWSEDSWHAAGAGWMRKRDARGEQVFLSTAFFSSLLLCREKKRQNNFNVHIHTHTHCPRCE